LYESFCAIRDAMKTFMDESALVLSESADKLRSVRLMAEEARFASDGGKPA
jgi:hypothetical protein